jgi:hypothetical protein
MYMKMKLGITKTCNKTYDSVRCEVLDILSEFLIAIQVIQLTV